MHNFGAMNVPVAEAHLQRRVSDESHFVEILFCVSTPRILYPIWASLAADAVIAIPISSHEGEKKGDAAASLFKDTLSAYFPPTCACCLFAYLLQTTRSPLQFAFQPDYFHCPP